MRISIIGAGNVGGALARAWVTAGHRIYVGTRDANQTNIKALTQHEGITAHSYVEAVSKSDVVLFSTPSSTIPSLVSTLGSLQGKILVDATNAVREKPTPYKSSYDALKALSGSSDVVKCFNSTGFENLANPISTTKYGNIPLDMFMAGESRQAKEVARTLASDAGFETCYDFGGDDKVELLEYFALVWINLAIIQKEGRNIGFKVLKRI